MTAPTSPSTSNPTDPATLFRLAREATGGDAWDGVRTLRLEGTIAAGGLRGPWVQVVELSRGRSATTLTLGPAALARGFDGTVAWQRGASGEVLVQDAEAARRAAFTEAWLNARSYLFAIAPDAADATRLESAPGDALHDVVVAHPAGGTPVALWFERATHRLVRLVQEQAGLQVVKRLDDHRPVGGLVLPMRIVTGTGDERRDMVVAIERVAVDVPVADADFAVPAAALDDVDWLADAPRATLAFDLVCNHVYVDARIGDAALRLMLDTGGTTLLTPEAAARAGLAVEGRLEARGPGERAVDVGFARVDRLVVGEAVALARQLVRVMPLPGFAAVEGTAFDGVLGVELFERLAVEIDYDGRTLHLARSADFTPAPGSTALPLAFYAHVPGVEATLDGHAGRFWLDTGNRNALTLWTPFVEAHDLAARCDARPETTIGWGVGGPSRGRVARGGRFTLGGLVVEAPVLTLPARREGPTAMRDVAGNIGGDLLRRFTVGFDYARRLVHLRPNARFGEPFVTTPFLNDPGAPADPADPADLTAGGEPA